MKSPQKSITDYIFSWTDRFLSAEVKADPDLHLRTQIGLVTAVFGTAGFVTGTFGLTCASVVVRALTSANA